MKFSLTSTISYMLIDSETKRVSKAKASYNQPEFWKEYWSKQKQ